MFLIDFKFQQNRGGIISVSIFNNGSSVSNPFLFCINSQSVSILETEHSVSILETENSVSNFVAKPIRRYFSIRLETKIPFVF